LMLPVSRKITSIQGKTTGSILFEAGRKKRDTKVA
jgi:hypothetical protein